MSKILILSANVWRFTDKTTGEVKSGVTIEYLNGCTEDNSRRGYFTLKASLADDFIPKLVNVPGVYEMDTTIKPVGSNRQGVIAISNLTYKQPYEFKF